MGKIILKIGFIFFSSIVWLPITVLAFFAKTTIGNFIINYDNGIIMVLIPVVGIVIMLVGMTLDIDKDFKKLQNLEG